MKALPVLAPLAVAVLALGACASDESPSDDPGTNDEPLSTVVDDVDTEVEQNENLGFEGDEDG